MHYNLFINTLYDLDFDLLRVEAIVATCITLNTGFLNRVEAELECSPKHLEGPQNDSPSPLAAHFTGRNACRNLISENEDQESDDRKRKNQNNEWKVFHKEIHSWFLLATCFNDNGLLLGGRIVGRRRSTGGGSAISACGRNWGGLNRSRWGGGSRRRRSGGSSSRSWCCSRLCCRHPVKTVSITQRCSLLEQRMIHWVGIRTGLCSHWVEATITVALRLNFGSKGRSRCRRKEGRNQKEGHTIQLFARKLNYIHELPIPQFAKLLFGLI